MNESIDQEGINPSGLCECGCGQPTNPARSTDRTRGYVAGEPMRYLRGHNHRHYSTVPAETNPSGLCECGCGGVTSIAITTNVAHGTVKGHHRRFLLGHNRKPDTPPLPPNPGGKCLCGCGRDAPIAPRTDSNYGWVKGHAKLFILNHHTKMPPPGLCECGCGETVSEFRKRFCYGHWARTQAPPGIVSDDFTAEDRGYVTACWIWRWSKDAKGYGGVNRAEARGKAHRAMYRQEVGPIPEGLQIDHLCNVTSCINPAHLEPVTNAENMRRRYEREREDARLASHYRKLQNAGLLPRV